MILTVDQLRQFVDFPTGSDADDALQILLDATEADIAGVTGAVDGNAVEMVEGGWSKLIVSRPISAVVTVTDDTYGTPLTLAADDYRHSAGGYVLRRLADGTNPGSGWGPWVSVTYTPVAALDQASVVQAGLVRLAISYRPGLQSMTIGDWSEAYQAAGADAGFTAERAALLATLTGGPSMVVI